MRALKNIIFPAILLCAVSLSLPGKAPASDNVGSTGIHDAWIAAAPPGSRVMAAYMKIKNNGSKAIEIAAPQSDDFSKTEFHRTVHENGMAKMEHQPVLTIPAGNTLSLEPGGYHLMLFNPARKFKVGDTSNFTFHLNGGKPVTVIATIKKPGFEAVDHHNHH